MIVVIGSLDLLEWVEPMLDPGDYEVHFLGTGDSPYAQIRSCQPHLVVLGLAADNLDSFRLLTALTIDEETRRIPVLTCLREYAGRSPLQSPGGEAADEKDMAVKPAGQVD
jgi:PleD family two-component response regulator